MVLVMELTPDELHPGWSAQFIVVPDRLFDRYFTKWWGPLGTPTAILAATSLSPLTARAVFDKSWPGPEQMRWSSSFFSIWALGFQMRMWGLQRFPDVWAGLESLFDGDVYDVEMAEST